MKTLRRVLLLSAAFLVVALGLLPLAHTDWAERVRGGGAEHHEHESPEREEARENGNEQRQPSYLGLVLPFVKEGVLMGVPLCLTLIILGVGRKVIDRAAGR